MKDVTVLPIYLTMALNSIVVQMQAERDAGGSIIQHWRVEEINNLIIPIIDQKKQEQISALVQESFALREQSKQLLAIVTKAVEVALEQGEDIAIKLLEESDAKF